MSPHKIYQYFSNIGKIQIASFIPGFAFIRFIEDEIGIQILTEHQANHRIEIENHSIQIKRADYTIVPYEMFNYIHKTVTTPIEIDKLLLQPEAEKSPKNILNLLNDDCFCSILTRLSLSDLFSVSKTCKRLHQISKSVFQLKYKKQHIALCDLVQNGNSIADIEYLISNFGSSITSIGGNGLNDRLCDGDGNKIIGLIDQHCKNLKSLSIDASLMRNVPIANFRQMYGRLEALVIDGFFCGAIVVLNYCHKLKVLQWNGNALDLRLVSLPRLLEINMPLTGHVGRNEFLRRHPHIERFTMQEQVGRNCIHFYDDFIVDYLPNLCECKISDKMYTFQGETISMLRKMRNLKSVSINFNGKPFGREMQIFCKMNIPIEKLQLVYGHIDDNAIGYICEMKTITRLCFIKCVGFNENVLIRLVQNLPNLQSIVDASGALLNLDKILPILKTEDIKWMNKISRDSFVSYVS